VSFPTEHRQLSDRDRELKTARAGAAGIEIQHAALQLLLRDMAVPINHGTNSGCLRLQIETFENMQNVNRNSVNFDNVGLWKIFSPGFSIYIAAHRCDRSNPRQAIKDFGIANISGVDDEA